VVQHDLDGNLVEDDKNRYTWDSENRLIRVESKDGKTQIEYVYDHQSRRTVRTETKNPGKENELRKTTYYLYDDWNLLAELEASTEGQPGTLNFEPATLHTWGRDLSGTLQGAGGVGGLLAISEGGSHRFPAYDANGNIGQLLDKLGQPVAAYAYDPFGNVTEMAGVEAVENPWRFSTKPVDAGTGWLYYGFRYYQPESGRWLGRDPVEEEGGVNLYGFVGNEPIGRVDRLGLLSTGKFIDWYFNAGGATYDIVAQGELSALKGVLSGFLADYEQEAWDAIKRDAQLECGKHASTVGSSASWYDGQEHTFKYSNRGNKRNPDVTVRNFWLGDTTVFWGLEGEITVNCCLETYSYKEKIKFSLRDRGADPLDIGIEIWGGDPYSITADWEENFPASGVFP
ncbi:MAG: RHS repeat-associated core domain-containing protein, partial [Verrucomicrobiaceae bacterium]|nr:RHS repeat-associated core domain-containing protein [Verrucomicrobiaceae bacterium]